MPLRLPGINRTRSNILAVDYPTQLPNMIGWWSAGGQEFVTNGAASFSGGQYLTIADNASLALGSKLSIALWINATSLPGAGTDIQLYNKFVLNTNCGISIAISSTGATKQIKVFAAPTINDNGTTYGLGGTTLSTATNYFIVIVYDGTQSGNANRLKIYLNAVAETCSFGGTIPATLFASTAATYLGAFDTTTNRYNGLLDNVILFNNYSLSQSEVTALYASGSGVSGKSLVTITDAAGTGTLLSHATSAWCFDGSTNLTKDYVGTNTLTNSGVTYAAGQVSSNVVVDGDAIATWKDLTTNGNDLTQAIASFRPFYTLLGGKPVVRFPTTASNGMGFPTYITSQTNFSIGADFYTTNTSQIGSLITFGDNVTKGGGLMLSASPGNCSAGNGITILASGSTCNAGNSPLTFASATWTSAFMTKGTGNTSLYKNATLGLSTPVTYNTPITGGSMNPDAYIANVYAYTRQLTNNEVTALLNYRLAQGYT